MVSITTNNTLRLPDGRMLGYADYGDAEGRPLFFFHGTPGSRLSGLIAGVVAGPLRGRVIALDRPGYGLSSYHPGSEIIDWPDDVAALADHLGYERFAVLGYSGGGPFAAACALRLADRLTATGIVSGIGPLDAAARRHFSRMQRLRFWGARTFPGLVRLAVWWSVWRVRDDPQRFFAAWSAGVPDCDREVLERPAIRATVIDDRRESLRPGSRGAAHEMVLLARPWGFRLDELRAPVHLWHGEADTVVPAAVGRQLSHAIPHCTATFYPELGHLLLVEQMETILRTLLEPDPEST